jgi:hypothetical protein
MYAVEWAENNIMHMKKKEEEKNIHRFANTIFYTVPHPLWPLLCTSGSCSFVLFLIPLGYILPFAVDWPPPPGEGASVGGGKRSVKLCVGGGRGDRCPSLAAFHPHSLLESPTVDIGQPAPSSYSGLQLLGVDSVPVICDLFVTVWFVKSFVDLSRTISKGAGRASWGKSAVRRFRLVSKKCEVTKNGNFWCYVSKMGCLLKRDWVTRCIEIFLIC